MNVLPRALLATAILVAALAPTPTIVASGECVEYFTENAADGLQVIANAGRSIALGFETGMPGDGTGFLVIINPAICGGLGLGLGGNDLEDPTELIPGLPTLIPLP